MKDRHIISIFFEGVGEMVRRRGGRVCISEVEKYFSNLVARRCIEEMGGVKKFFQVFGDNYGLYVNEKEKTIEILAKKPHHTEKQTQPTTTQQQQPFPKPCQICATNPRSIVFLTCGHLATCEGCGEKMNRPEGGVICPICWVDSPAKIKILF